MAGFGDTTNVVEKPACLIVGIEGHFVKKVSFWIEQADLVWQYQNWLPQRDETTVQVRFYGKHILTIDHEDDVVDPAIDNYPPSAQNGERV